MDWFDQNSAALISACIGVIGALVVNIIMQAVQSRKRKQEVIDKAKPIVINCAYSQINKSGVMYYHFVAEGQRIDNIVGVFKNTGNGILFIDYIDTGYGKYYPVQNSTVDKDTEFCIVVEMVNKQTLDEKLVIYCHDIFGTKYYFDAHFDFEIGSNSQIVIDDSMPKPIPNKNTRKKKGKENA